MPILGENSRDELGGARRGGATKKPERERGVVRQMRTTGRIIIQAEGVRMGHLAHR
jgi:hypothetical protein